MFGALYSTLQARKVAHPGSAVNRLVKPAISPKTLA